MYEYQLFTNEFEYQVLEHLSTGSLVLECMLLQLLLTKF